MSDRWSAAPACAGVDPELFGPIERGESRAETPRRVLTALRFCRGLNPGAAEPCPVIAECADLRAENGFTGVWGGEWWPSSKAPTGYGNGLLRGARNDRRATSPIPAAAEDAAA